MLHNNLHCFLGVQSIDTVGEIEELAMYLFSFFFTALYVFPISSDCYKVDSSKFWLGPNYRGTHSTSRGLGSLTGVLHSTPRQLFRDEELRSPFTSDFVSAFFSTLDKSHALEFLELGCGEGRALSQFIAKYSANFEVRGTCFNLRGYKRVKRGPPISGAVSFDSPAEIRKMLEHYHIGIVRDDLIPKVVLGDASKFPWPFRDNMFSFMMSQASLSKISELDVVVSEVVRTLQHGGLAALGLGGTLVCAERYWTLPLEQRQLFCDKVSINGHVATVAVTMKAPFDDLTTEEVVDWQRYKKKSYRGGMVTTVVVSKGQHNLLECPKSELKENQAKLALRSCRRYTPAWNRGVKVITEFLDEHVLYS